MSGENRAEQVVAEAERLIADVTRQLDAGEQFYRDHGIDPKKMTAMLDPYLGPKEKEDLARILKEDSEAIQQEVDEAAARMRFSSGQVSGTKKIRSMI
jgi:hypothetical protein